MDCLLESSVPCQESVTLPLLTFFLDGNATISTESLRLKKKIKIKAFPAILNYELLELHFCFQKYF